MQIKSIADCSKRAFCNTSTFIKLQFVFKTFFAVYFWSDRLRHVLLYYFWHLKVDILTNMSCLYYFQLNNYDHLLTETGRSRVASACSRQTLSRLSTPTTDGANSKPKRLSEREMSRLIRRLQKPTETFKLATSMPPTDEDKENMKQGKIVRCQSADITRAKVAKLRRPTTATLAKTLNTCHLCYDHENKKNPEEKDAFDYDYCNSKVVPTEEVDFLVERIKTPTVASVRGRWKCAKTPEYIDEVQIRQNLPLLSGLARSKTVREITQRLYPKRHLVPQATPITIYT